MPTWLTLVRISPVVAVRVKGCAFSLLESMQSRICLIRTSRWRRRHGGMTAGCVWSVADGEADGEAVAVDGFAEHGAHQQHARSLEPTSARQVADVERAQREALDEHRH